MEDLIEKAKFALRHGEDYDSYAECMEEYLNEEVFRMDEEQLVEMFKYFSGKVYDGTKLF